MTKEKSLTGLFVVVCLLAILLVQLSVDLPSLQAELLWQSDLPTPREATPGNPNFVRSSDGGQIYCGSQQSSVWLALAAGFTPENGAEIHCDPSGSLAQWNNTAEAWDDRGYTIGIYPAVVLAKPVELVFELDPTRASGICETCLVGKYYDAEGGSWHDLPSSYDPGTMRCRVKVAEVLPRSGYPAYEDRFIVALFARSTTQKPSPSSTPKPSATSTAKPSSTSTTAPAATRTRRPTATPTVTRTPQPTATSRAQPTLTRTSIAFASATLTALPTVPSVARALAVPETGAPAVTPTPSIVPPLLVGGGILFGVGVAVVVLKKRSHNSKE